MHEDQEFKLTLKKAARFCSLQERCRQDNISKLRSWNCNDSDLQERILKWLESEDYLDESRYAELYSGGKLRINKWGRNKIRASLESKNIDAENIENALSAIDDKEYFAILTSVIRKKERELGDIAEGEKRHKLYAYVTSKGFEPELLSKVLHIDH